MKKRDLLPLLLSCQLVWACAPDQGSSPTAGLTSVSQALSAKPVDQETKLYRIKDGSNYFPLLQSNDQIFVLNCEDEQNIVESIGIPYDANNYLHPENTHDIYSDVIFELLTSHEFYSIQDVPEIKCNSTRNSLRVATLDFEGDTDYEAWDVNDGDETDDDDEKKYFLKVRGHYDDDYIIGYMIGCTAFIDALGLDRNSASTVNAEDYNIGDEYDINCYEGKVTQPAMCLGEKPEFSVWCANNGAYVDPDTGEFEQEWDPDARLWQPRPGDCEWVCDENHVIKNGIECVDPECVSGIWDESDVVCGPNGNGRKKKVCEGGLWSLKEICLGADDCHNDDDELVSNDCGVNKDDPYRRECIEGQWAYYCDYQDVCKNDEDFLESFSCGLCGNDPYRKKCTNGQWNYYCDAQDVCCAGDYQEQFICGKNNRDRYVRYCTDGQWVSNWECEEQDTCTIGEETETITFEMNLPANCGINQRGTPASAYCPNGQWEMLECNDPDVCEDNLVQETQISCGYNGNGIKKRRCNEGQWGNYYCVDPDECRNNSRRTVSCGTNRERTDICSSGNWVEGICQVKCKPGEKRCGFQCWPSGMHCP